MPDRSEVTAQLLSAAKELVRELKPIDFSSITPWIYNPLEYAWDPYAEYLTRYCPAHPRAVYMGMNPGPWGMVQTGIPFGEVAVVRDWLGIKSQAKQPPRVHPKRPIEGLLCRRSEVSGKRLWGLFASRFEKPAAFFEENFVINYCPLAFMDTSGRNLTPDKFPVAIRRALEDACDRHLIATLKILRPQAFVCIGTFAESCIKRCHANDNQLDNTMRLVRILHPSPASPAANRNWDSQTTATLEKEEIWR